MLDEMLTLGDVQTALEHNASVWMSVAKAREHLTE
jgi:hypothetical protein